MDTSRRFPPPPPPPRPHIPPRPPIRPQVENQGSGINYAPAKPQPREENENVQPEIRPVQTEEQVGNNKKSFPLQKVILIAASAICFAGAIVCAYFLIF